MLPVVSCPKADGVAAVMNYTEMEAKVREATNNEPWVGLNFAGLLRFGVPLPGPGV